MEVKRIFSKIKAPGIILIFAIFVIASSFATLLSCSPQQVFGDLLVCGDVDSDTFMPIDIRDEYEIGSTQIIAVIKVSGVRGNERWRFTWRSTDTGEVIADSTNTYSSNNPAFMEGYISSKLLPAEGSGIIAEPGEYTVSYYHDGELKSTAGFTIKRPIAEIMDVGLYKDLDEDGGPGLKAREFYQGDEIYAAIKLDYKIAGDIFGIRWFQDENLLGEEDYTVTENTYIPGYIIFQLLNEDQAVFPVGSYRLEITSYGEVFGEYSFNIIPEEYADSIFAGNQVYQNEEFGFEVLYPDGWKLEEENIEAGPKIGLTPDDGIKQIIINMWAFKKDYSPSQDDYSSYADGRLEELKGQEEDKDIEKTESSKTIGDLEVFEIRYDNINETGGHWSITFSFFKKDELTFLFTRLTDPAYIEYGERVVEYMIDSINFNQ